MKNIFNQNTVIATSDSTSLSEKIIRGSRTILFFSTFSAPIGYLTRMIYSRTLSVEEYGLFYSVLAFYMAISTYNDLGFGYSVSFFVPKFLKEKNYKYLWNAFEYGRLIEVSSSLVLGILIIALSPWLERNYFKQENISLVISLMVLYFVANSAISAMYKFFIGLQKESLYSSIYPCLYTITLILSGLLFITNAVSIVNIASVWTLSSIITFVIYYPSIYFLKRRYKVTFEWIRGLFKMMISNALPTFLSNSIDNLTRFVDIFFLTTLAGFGAVGQYNIVVPIMLAMNIFFTPLLNFVLPFTSELAETKPEYFSKIVRQILIVFPVLGYYFGLFIFMFPAIITSILFGNQWLGIVENNLKLASVFYPLLLPGLFLAAVSAGLGLVKERLRISIILALLSVVGGFFLIRSQGVTGAIISNSLIYISIILLYIQAIKKKVKIDIDYQSYINLLMILGTIYFLFIVVFKQHPKTFIHLISLGVIYSLIFWTLILVTRTIDVNLIVKIFNFKLKGKNAS